MVRTGAPTGRRPVRPRRPDSSHLPRSEAVVSSRQGETHHPDNPLLPLPVLGFVGGDWLVGWGGGGEGRCACGGPFLLSRPAGAGRSRWGGAGRAGRAGPGGPGGWWRGIRDPHGSANRPADHLCQAGREKIRPWSAPGGVMRRGRCRRLLAREVSSRKVGPRDDRSSKRGAPEFGCFTCRAAGTSPRQVTKRVRVASSVGPACDCTHWRR